MSANALIAISLSSSSVITGGSCETNVVDVFGVGNDPVQAAHAAAARPEDVHRAEADGLDNTVVVLGVNLHGQVAAGVTGARSMPRGS